MQESPIVRVHLDNRSEDRYTSIQLSETSTAEEVCKSAVLKLVGSVQSTQSADLKDYGLFVRTRSAEMKMKERKFAAFELPAVILVSVYSERSTDWTGNALLREESIESALQPTDRPVPTLLPYLFRSCQGRTAQAQGQKTL